jgi:hypothetical protein
VRAGTPAALPKPARRMEHREPRRVIRMAVDWAGDTKMIRFVTAKGHHSYTDLLFGQMVWLPGPGGELANVDIYPPDGEPFRVTGEVFYQLCLERQKPQPNVHLGEGEG